MSKLHDFLQIPINKYINLITSLFRPKSIRKLFSKAFLILILLFSILFAGSCFYFSSIMRNQVYNTMKETMALYNEQLCLRFQEALTFLSENCLQNTDVAIINTTADANERYLRTARLKKDLSTGTCSLSTIGGLFMYFSDPDLYIPQISSFWDNNQNNLKCSSLIRNLLRSHSKNELNKPLNLNNWFFLSENEDFFLVRIIKTRNVYAGAWIELDKISSSFKRFEDIGATILYVDDSGNCIGNSKYNNVRLNPAASLDKISYYRESFTEKYFTVSVELDDCDYYIVALIPFSYIRKQLIPLYGLMIFFLCFAAVFCILMISSINHFFNTPSQILQPVIQSLRNGDFESKVESDCPFQEIQNITNVFNDMINEIQNLRIRIYEQQLAKKRLELQYLKTQVAPHFLINCLNTIFVLSQDPKKQDLTHRFVQTLSEHLRYTLAMRDSISLKEELYYAENYLLLTQLRFPETLTYQIQVESSVLNAQVFPMVLLMLTENSIKANVVMSEQFFVYIEGYLYEKNGQQLIHLTHIDSGSGFKSQNLDLYNHITEYTDLQKNGYGIGIYNTVMRLKLTFGDSSSILFSNDPKYGGARIDIDFPYIPYSESDS